MKISSDKLYIILLATAIAVGQMGSSFYLPALPVIGRDLNTNASWMALTLTIYYAGFSLSTLMAGPLSDALGRKKIILYGLLIYAVGTLVCIFCRDIFTLLAGRLIQSIGACAAPVAGRAMIKDIAPEDKVAVYLGWLGVTMGAMPAIAPTLGGFIVEHFGWRMNFSVLLLFCILIFILCYFLLIESLDKTKKAKIKFSKLFEDYMEIFKYKKFQKNVFPLALCFAGVASFFTVAPYVFIHNFNLTPTQYGFTNIAVVAGFLVGNVFVSKFVQKISSSFFVKTGGKLIFF